jgi:hypothetical protein
MMGNKKDVPVPVQALFHLIISSVKEFTKASEKYAWV